MHPSVHVSRHHARKQAAPRDAALAPEVDLSRPDPPPFDRPVGAINQVFLSPVTNAMLANDQEMQSGADELSGVHGSRLSGGDYSREQGVGRSPGWQWPWNHHSGAFNVQSLDRWAIERTGLGELDPHSGVNPYVGVPEPPYSPIAAMDQYTMFYENSPEQHHFWPTPISIPQVEPVAFTEQAVLG